MSHSKDILDQFTKQAGVFARKMEHTQSIEFLIEQAALRHKDRVLDVACGPGLLACAIANEVVTVTGIDMTPAMLEQAAERQQSLGLTNVTWDQGSAYCLPYPNGSFTRVLSRYSFHHFDQPATALAEMRRVCKKGGLLVIADFDIAPLYGNAFNQMEKLRDPSHVHAFSQQEFTALIKEAGFKHVYVNNYTIDMELEGQLAASFPLAGDVTKIRALFQADLADGKLGLNSRMVSEDGQQKLYFTYPIGVYVMEK